MSTTETGKVDAEPAQQTVEVDATALQRVHERLDELEAENRSLRSRLDELEAQNDTLGSRVDELEAENDTLSNRVDELESEQRTLQESLHSVESELEQQPEVRCRDGDGIDELRIDGYPLGRMFGVVKERQNQLTELLTGDPAYAVELDEMVSEYDPLVDGLGEARAMRERYLTDKQEFKSEFAQFRRQLNHLSEETDVDVLDAIPGDDKIAKIVTNGVASVVDGRITQTYERAEKLLDNLDEWASIRRDNHRAYATYTSSTAKEKLETARMESLQTTQVRRAFEKIRAWADDSPRVVHLDKDERGRWRLRVSVTPDEEAD